VCRSATDKVEHTFAAILEIDLTGDIYPMKILNLLFAKIRWRMRMLKGQNVGIQKLTLASVLKVLICLHLPFCDHRTA
jgi:hypothetical protein